MLKRLEIWLNILICVLIVEFIGSTLNDLYHNFIPDMIFPNAIIMKIVRHGICSAVALISALIGRFVILRKKNNK